jgi:hypothetical protein
MSARFAGLARSLDILCCLIFADGRKDRKIPGSWNCPPRNVLLSLQLQGYITDSWLALNREITGRDLERFFLVNIYQRRADNENYTSRQDMDTACNDYDVNALCQCVWAK